jgi:hypothetical protein
MRRFAHYFQNGPFTHAEQLRLAAGLVLAAQGASWRTNPLAVGIVDDDSVVRTLGGCEYPTGSPVTLRASGPVLAWPR